MTGSAYPERHAAGDWIDRAACAGFPTAIFFMPSLAAIAKTVCGWCDVTEDCLAYAQLNDEEYGVWGGFTTGERRWMSR